PAVDVVMLDDGGRGKALVVMQVRHSSHGDSFADDRAINMSVRAAAVHRHVVSGRIDRSSNLTIATNAYVRPRIRWRLNPVQHSIAWLSVAVPGGGSPNVRVARLL